MSPHRQRYTQQHLHQLRIVSQKCHICACGCQEGEGGLRGSLFHIHEPQPGGSYQLRSALWLYVVTTTPQLSDQQPRASMHLISEDPWLAGVGSEYREGWDHMMKKVREQETEEGNSKGNGTVREVVNIRRVIIGENINRKWKIKTAMKWTEDWK